MYFKENIFYNILLDSNFNCEHIISENKKYESIWKGLSDIYVWRVACDWYLLINNKGVGCVIDGFPSGFKVNL